MNEQIKSIALECYNPYGNFDIEKFAELIIRECAGVSENHKGMNDKYFIADAIKKHFGVEE